MGESKQQNQFDATYVDMGRISRKTSMDFDFTDKLTLKFSMISVESGKRCVMYEEYINAESDGGDDAVYRRFMDGRWKIGTGWFHISSWHVLEDAGRIAEAERQRIAQREKIELANQQMMKVLEAITSSNHKE